MKVTQFTCCACALSLVASLAGTANAQLPVRLNQNARAAANVTERVRTQVQQRLQAQSQRQIQVQARQRLESQARLRVRAGQAARVRTDVRIKQGTQVDGPAARQTAGTRASANARLASGRVGVPVVVTAEEQQQLDVVFGRYNPFRSKPATDGTPSTAEKRAAADPPPAATAQSTTGERAVAEGEADAKSEANGKVGLIFRSQADLDATINAAIRQRKAEIASVRDNALAQGNAALLAQADRNEKMLAAFASYEARARAKAEAAAKASAKSGASGRPVIQAAGEARGEGVIRAGGKPETAPPREQPKPESINQ